MGNRTSSFSITFLAFFCATENIDQEAYQCMAIPYLISLWTDGCMDCFHLLPIVILLGINIDVQVFCGCMYALLSGIYLGVEVLGHMVSVYYLLFTETAVPVYSPVGCL